MASLGLAKQLLFIIYVRISASNKSQAAQHFQLLMSIAMREAGFFILICFA